MTTLDDPEFLLRHLRTCFITSDDTGLCEVIIEPDLLRDAQKRRERSGSRLTNSSGESDNELSVSPDILSDVDFGGGRLRSNTSLRVEKIKREKFERLKVKSVKLKKALKLQPDEKTVDELFVKKEVKPITGRRHSALSELIKQSTARFASHSNAFDEYKQFNAELHPDKPHKKIEIFMTMERNKKALSVLVVHTATVEETIGLACWMYTNTGCKPELREEIEAFSLHMTEDDGTVDEDFPALDSKEPISKFGFVRLALVMKEALSPEPTAPPVPPPRPVTVPDENDLYEEVNQLITVNLEGMGSSKLLINREQLTVLDLLKMILEKRNIPLQSRSQYRLKDSLYRQLNPSRRLSDVPTTEFHLVTQTATRPNSTSEEGAVTTETLGESGKSPKSFIVNLVTKQLFSNAQVQLNISPEMVEVIPLSSKNSLRSMFSQKTTIINMSNILVCSVTKQKSSGKTQFNIHYNASESPQINIQQFIMEATEQTANEIVERITRFIDKTNRRAMTDVSAFGEKKRRQSSMY